MRDIKNMKCNILRWLLGIWLVETVAARHILDGEDTGNKHTRAGRDQFHPFYQQPPHLSYNSFRSSLRRTPPQVPGRRDLIEQDGSHDQQYYNNYYPTTQQNLNLYSAVRLHGALETRARNEPGTESLLPNAQHVNFFHPQPHQVPYSRPANRHWRRDEDSVDGESFEREDDLARFSLYNSYFDNEHSIKALNSMKCVTPTGSPGFCSTFKGCVPSFFTKDGDLEAPALAELISTSIGYCTTNVSHHFIREQKQFAHATSREERRFNSVANRIICCPGVAPERDPNQDPDKIFNDYIDSQKSKTSTTTTTLGTTLAPAVSDSDGAMSDGAAATENETVVPSKENPVNDGDNLNQEGSHHADQTPAQELPPMRPEQSQTESQLVEQGSSGSTMYPEGTDNNSINNQQQESSSPSSGSTMYPDGANNQVNQQTEGSVTEAHLESASATEATSQHVVEQESTSISTSQQTPSNDEPEPSPVTESAASSPGSEQSSPGKLPPKTQDSNIIKIYPEPVSGVNGKFTLPGGIYIVSTSTDTPNNNQPKPAHPSGEQVVGGVSPGDETIIGSKPIIIVTNPGTVTSPDEPLSPMVPHFPGDFPPMGSDEIKAPPVEDSSLELRQRPRPQMPDEENLVNSPTFVPQYPGSSSSAPISELQQTTISSGIVNDEEQSVSELTGVSMQYPSTGQPEVQTTTGEALQDENFVPVTTERIATSASDLQNQKQEESTAPAGVTTAEPQEPVNHVSGSSTIPTITDRPPLNDDEDGNDAVTILPVNPSSSTTENSVVAESATTIKSGDVSGGQEQQEDVFTTVSSVSAGVANQDGEFTTRQPSEVNSGVQASETETSTILAEREKAQQQQQATTLSPLESDESEESNEDKAATVLPAGVQADTPETTLAPAISDDSISQSGVAGIENIQEDENIRITTTISADDTSTTIRTVSTQQQQSNNDSAMTYPPESVTMLPGMQYPPTSVPAAQVDTSNVGTVPPKLVLSPGSESTEAEVETGSLPALPSEPSNDEGGNLSAADTLQPFPVQSPASTGDAGESEQQQTFPAPDSSANQHHEQDLEPFVPTTTVSSSSNQPQQQPVQGSEQQQPFPDSDSSTVFPTTGEHEIGATSESSPTVNDGDAARLPSTDSPAISSDSQQDSEPGVTTTSQSSSVPGGEQSSADGTITSDDPLPPLSSSGNDSTGTTNQSPASSGSEPISAGSESPVHGSEAAASGTESSSAGSDSSPTEPSSQNDEPVNEPGTEPHSSTAPADTTTESTNGVSSSSQTSASTPNTNEPAAVTTEFVDSEKPQHQPAPVPSNDEPATTDDAELGNNEIPISSTPVPPANGGSTETQVVSQEPVPSIPSDTAETSSPVQGPAPEADSPVSSDIVQNPQPGSSTSEAPQNVSSPDSVASSAPEMAATTYPSTSTTTSASTDLPSPQPVTPNYQILKACKFQSFFRSVNDMTYSYRHYPWLATIVGGTRPFSSGTLITDRHILTASHFLANITVSDVFNMRIHIGYRTSYSGQTEGPYAVRKVRKVIRHKGFSFEKLYNDIAVLVLDRPVRFSEDIYPVCISSNRTAYSNGTVEAFETGWIEDPRAYTISQHHNYVDPHILKYFSFGYKNITWRLQEAPQRVRTNTECQSNYSFLEKNGIVVTDSMVCAGSGDTRSCAFRGNSGAPLFLRNENDRMTEQIGIVSFGVACAHFPFVFTRVESFLPWLDRVVYNSR